MTEVNKNQNDDSKNKEIEQLKREKAAIEMKLRRSDEDLYSEDYLNFLQEQKGKQPPQNSFMSGGKISDYSDEELQNMPISKLAAGIAGEVLSVIEAKEQSKMTKEQAKARSKKVKATRKEIEDFVKDYPDFWNFAAKIDELSNENPNLTTAQLYQLAGGKLEEKPPPEKQEEKKEPPPNTRATVEAGVKPSVKNLSRREIIQEEWQKSK